MALSAALIGNADGGLAVVSNPHVVEMFFTVTASGSYVTGGDTLDLTAITGAPGLVLPPTGQLPLQVVITGIAGYDYKYVNGSAQNNGLVQVRQSAGSAAPMSQIAQSSYPAGVTGDTIIGRATFLRG